MTLQRLQKEWNVFRNNPVENVSAAPLDDEMFHWCGKIIGPIDTPFEGGVFVIDIVCPANYPFRAPRYTMLTKMFHPNISAHGEICMSILGADWDPVLTIEKMLLSISSIFDTPSMQNPINLEAAQCFREDREKYNAVVRQYTLDYAQESTV